MSDSKPQSELVMASATLNAESRAPIRAQNSERQHQYRDTRPIGRRAGAGEPDAPSSGAVLHLADETISLPWR